MTTTFLKLFDTVIHTEQYRWWRPLIVPVLYFDIRDKEDTVSSLSLLNFCSSSLKDLRFAKMTSKKEDFIVADLGEWKKQLITKEDPIHLHKTLGILCLLSFIWRFAHIGDSDMGFLSHPSLTIPTVCLHFLLTASAFDFKIPARRIKDGTRIWPEYRMHAMVFLCRSLAVISMYWYETRQGLERNYDFNLFVVLASMAVADLCSASVAVIQPRAST